MIKRGRPFFSLAALGLFSLLVFGAAAFAAGTADTVKAVAVVNGEAITVKMIERELIRIHTVGAAESLRTHFNLDKLVQRMINDRLLAQDARTIGLDQDSAIVERVQRYRDNAAYKMMVKEILPDTFQASEEEIRAEYAKQMQRFELRTLCVLDSGLARALADSIRQGVPFADLAQRHSIDRFKTKGGAAGAYVLADVPPLVREEALTARDGQVFGPRFMWRTYALIQIEKRLGPDSAVTIDSVRADMTKLVIAAKRAAARHDYIQTLRAKFPVALDSAAIDSIMIRMAQNLPARDRAVLTVGRKTLSETELRGKYMHKISSNSELEPRSVLMSVLDEQTETLLLQAEAGQSRFRDIATVVESAKAYEDSILVLAYLQDVVALKVTVTDGELAAFYEQNKSYYHEPNRFSVKVITRKSEQEAEDDYQKLLAGADFGWLARHHSTDEARDKGGEIGWVTPDKLPSEVAIACDTVKVGTVLKPVKTDQGVVVVKLVDRQTGATLSLEKVKANVEANVQRRKQMEAIDETIKKLRESAEIHVNENVIGELRITGKKS